MYILAGCYTGRASLWPVLPHHSPEHQGPLMPVLPRAPHDTGWVPLTALLVRAVRTLLLAIAEPGNGDAAGNAGGLA